MWKMKFYTEDTIVCKKWGAERVETKLFSLFAKKAYEKVRKSSFSQKLSIQNADPDPGAT
jgi:hypothetical protein